MERKEKLLDNLRSLASRLSEDQIAHLIQEVTVLINERDAFTPGRGSRTPKSPRKEGKSPVSFAVERSGFDGSHIFHLYGRRKSLADFEIRELARYATAGKRGEDRIYAWLLHNRRDVLIDSGIDSPSDPVINQMMRFLRKYVTNV